MPDFWYVISVVKGKELKAKVYCEKQGIETCLPMISKTTGTTLQKNVSQKELIFPSIMFIKIEPEQIDVLKSSSIIKNFMYFHDKPATISGREIESLNLFLEKHSDIELERIPVKIIHPEAGFTASQFITVTKTSCFLVLPSIGYKLVTPNRTHYSFLNVTPFQDESTSANKQ